jgi:hypothetical protein
MHDELASEWSCWSALSPGEDAHRRRGGGGGGEDFVDLADFLEGYPITPTRMTAIEDGETVMPALAKSSRKPPSL